MSGSRRTLHWDGTVTAGNALTAATVLVGLLIWGIRLEGRVDRAEDRQARFEAVAAQHRAEDRATESLSFAELRSALRRIEDILLRQAQRDRTQP